MSAVSADARRDLPLAAAAAVTTWVTMLSWRGFSTVWGGYLGPLIVVAAVVAIGGVLLRASPVPRRAGLLLHVLLVVVVLWLMLGGSLLHPVLSAHHIGDSLANAWNSGETYLPPVPANVPSIAPMMIPFGALALLVVDVLACWFRRVSLAGLPLLAIYCVPISLLGRGVSWLVFLVGAGGYLLMMFLQESAHITRWGRPLGGVGDAHGFGVSTGASKASATSVGALSVVLAIVLPLFIPTLHLDGLGLFGPGGSGGGGVKVINPITDMRRNLQRGADVPLLSVRTDDPDPSYLRIAVLSQFNGVEWTSGDRQIVSDQLANGIVPLEQGLGNDVPLRSHNYRVTATSDFVSRWLPTEFPVSDVVADGNWHYDTSTMDFIAVGDQTTTAGRTWSMTAAKPQLSNFSMTHSLTAPLSIQSPFTSLPSTLPNLVPDLARQVTKGAQSRFEEAVMLQRWFRTTGHFRYSLKTAPGDGSDALLRFLAPGQDGRVGYCEQFASAFAVMARTLSIPARVAVGFLQPTKNAAGDWIYSAHDLHAWPEVYFAGSGWVRFEPTPAGRTGAAPTYTSLQVRNPTGPQSSDQTGGGRFTERPSASASTKGPHNETTSGSSAGTHVPWTAVLLALGSLLVLAALALVPGAVRRSRRSRRLAGGAESAWAELRDSAVDLAVSWPPGRSPHETGYHLAGWFGAEPDGPPPVRPPRGRGLAPGAEDALDRIVLTLERVRYARRSDDRPGALAEDVLTCITSLEHGCTTSVRRRARWLPRSLFGRGRRRAAERAARDREPEAVSAGGVVDHVG